MAMTPEKRVEEIVEHAKKSLRKAGFIAATLNKQETADTQLDFILRYILTQDRASLHTSLVAAVEGLKNQAPYTYDDDMCQAIDDTLTIINSIFKE